MLLAFACLLPRARLAAWRRPLPGLGTLLGLGGGGGSSSSWSEGAPEPRRRTLLSADWLLRVAVYAAGGAYLGMQLTLIVPAVMLLLHAACVALWLVLHARTPV